MEYEDRLSELRLFFICAWRQLPTNTGHFLEDFERLCREHMRKVARSDSFHRYAVLSMDAPLVCKNGAERFPLAEIIAAPEEDETVRDVERFLASLGENERSLLEARLDRVPKAALARERKLTLRELDSILHELGHRYLREYRKE